MVRIGLIGYGVGGRLFHSPYLAAAKGVDFAGVVARSPERAAEVHADWPEVPVYPSLDELAASGVDAVVISTPPHTRADLVLAALARNLHVVADKPFAPSATAAQNLASAAADAGLLLNVFHNRRWDSDIVTARAVIESGALGTLQRLDLRCDQDDPSTLEEGATGGLLRDLGSHVVDQALYLMGPASSVYAQLDDRDLPGGRTDVAFAITVVHRSGTHSHITSSKVNRLDSRELRVLGANGSYVSDYRDVQVDAIRAGGRPAHNREEWGFESADRWGTLRTIDGDRVIPSAQGDYTRFYEEFARAIESGAAGPVPSAAGIAVLRVLDAARVSAAEGHAVAVS